MINFPITENDYKSIRFLFLLPNEMPTHMYNVPYLLKKEQQICCSPFFALEFLIFCNMFLMLKMIKSTISFNYIFPINIPCFLFVYRHIMVHALKRPKTLCCCLFCFLAFLIYLIMFLILKMIAKEVCNCL